MLENTYLIFGIIFLILGILVAIRNCTSKRYHDFFWFCDLLPFLLAFAFFIQNEQLIKALINIGFISQSISLFNLSAAIFFGIDIMGFADILNYNKFYITISYLLHLLPLNLALFFTYDIPPKIISLVYSFVIMLILFFLTIFFTKSKDNINYVDNIDFLGFSIPYYKFLCIPIFFIFIILPTYGIQYLLYFFFH